MGFDWNEFSRQMFGGPEEPLDGLHISRAGDFYWPDGEGSVNHYPPSAPALTAGQIRARLQTSEVRKVRANG